MKVRDMIASLEDYDEDMEVVLQSQPDRHPLYYKLRKRLEDEGDYVVLVEGNQIGYSLPHRVYPPDPDPREARDADNR